MTLFAKALKLCGYSYDSFGEDFTVNKRTVYRWAKGSARIPPNIWLELAASYERINAAGEHATDQISTAGTNPIDWNSLDLSLPDEWQHELNKRESDTARAHAFLLHVFEKK